MRKKKVVVERIFTEDGEYFYLNIKPEVLFPKEFEKREFPIIVSRTKFENVDLYGKVIFLDTEHYTYEKAKNITFKFHKPYDASRAPRSKQSLTLSDYNAYSAKKVKIAILVPIVNILILSFMCGHLFGGILGFGWLSPIMLPITYAEIAFFSWLEDKEFERREDKYASRKFRREFMSGMIGADIITRNYKRK